MDWIAFRKLIQEWSKKYRYAVMALAAGLVLMLIPKQEIAETPILESVQPSKDLQSSLEDILSQISGAGKVKVLLTQAEGEKTFFQTDEEITESKTRRESVLVTNSSREETGLVKQIIPPRYLGALVVCEGAENATVRLCIVEAIMSVTGLTSDRITVLRMK